MLPLNVQLSKKWCHFVLNPSTIPLLVHANVNSISKARHVTQMLTVSSVRLLCLRKLCFGLHCFLHCGCVLMGFGCPRFQMQTFVSEPTQRNILTDIIPAPFSGQRFAANDVKDRFSGLFDLFMIFHTSNSFPLFFPCIQTPCFSCDNLAKLRLHPNLS